ncbi:MAG: hypothetical protein D6738_11385 [Acidobacteria bacterium]|nr:MAG: hypothetical protein D6738_11385 [Acidobacteriota bacterium]
MEDLEFMVSTFEEVHPDLWFRADRESVARLTAELASRIDRPMTRLEFWPLAARLAASFGDGHTGVMLPVEEFRRARDRGERWFPLEVDAFGPRGLRVLAAHEAEDRLAPGSWITRIGRHPADELFAQLMAEMSGEMESYRAFQLLRSFNVLLWANGIEAPFEVDVLVPGENATRTLHLEGVTWDRLTGAEGARRDDDQDFRFERLAGDIGYLELRRMRGFRAFTAFLEHTFRDIRERPVRGLVIDLRRNGGGSTAIGDALLAYITDRPYRMIARMELKASRRKKEWLESQFIPRALRWLPLLYLQRDVRRVWSARDGSLVTWEIDPRPPEENPLRYRGPVCVLIGPQTFSSAQKLANAIKDYRLATLIGQETGGIPNAFGEAYDFRLPNTRLVARASTKRYVRANGDRSWTRGILPDIEVIPTPEDERAGRDPVLDAALAWIDSSASAAASCSKLMPMAACQRPRMAVNARATPAAVTPTREWQRQPG